MKSASNGLIAFAFCLSVVFPSSAFGDAFTFEGFSDGTFISTQLTGLSFSNALILTAGISLNEAELPPHSGVNVLTDSSGPISILFTSAASSFSAYFTYGAPLTISAYDSSSNLIATISSAYSNNFALSGDAGSSPNELLQLSPSTDIAKLVIAGSVGGSSFVLDDLSFTVGSGGNIGPEPGTLGLVCCLGVLVLTWRFRQVRRGRS